MNNNNNNIIINNHYSDDKSKSIFAYKMKILEMERAVHFRKLWNKNSRLPIKKRFSRCVTYDSDSKQRKVDIKDVTVVKDVKREEAFTPLAFLTKLSSFWDKNNSAAALTKAVYEAALKWQTMQPNFTGAEPVSIARVFSLAAFKVAREERLKGNLKPHTYDDQNINEMEKPCIDPTEPLIEISVNEKENVYIISDDSETDSGDEQPITETPRGETQELVPIGDGYAHVPARVLHQIDWNSYTAATRKLVTAVFPRRILSTHSLTGKASPAFPHRAPKKKLPVGKVNDIVQTVVERCGVQASLVRAVISIKCTDEAKLVRHQQQSKSNLR